MAGSISTDEEPKQTAKFGTLAIRSTTYNFHRRANPLLKLHHVATDYQLGGGITTEEAAQMSSEPADKRNRDKS